MQLTIPESATTHAVAGSDSLDELPALDLTAGKFVSATIAGPGLRPNCAAHKRVIGNSQNKLPARFLDIVYSKNELEARSTIRQKLNLQHALTRAATYRSPVVDENFANLLAGPERFVRLPVC